MLKLLQHDRNERFVLVVGRFETPLELRHLLAQFGRVGLAVDRAHELFDDGLLLGRQTGQIGILVGGRASLAGINRRGPVLLREISGRDTLHIGRGHRLQFGAALVEFAPGAVTFVEDQLVENRHVGRELPIFLRGKLVFHLLQFLRRKVLIFQPVQFLVERHLDILGLESLAGFTADVENPGPLL